MDEKRALPPETSAELQIAEWRTYVVRRMSGDGPDVEELEAHLRDQIVDLEAAGLSEDEAFLVAVKRLGSADALSREFAQEHSGRLWKQLVLAGEDDEPTRPSGLVVALGFAVAAAVTMHIARTLAGWPDGQSAWLERNAVLLVAPFIAGYLAQRRRLAATQLLVTAAILAATALVVNLYPFTDGGSTQLLVLLHVPILLWFGLAHPYTGGAWRSRERRMDFVRFTGEWFIYMTLLALGGGVLLALTVLVLDPLDPVLAEAVAEWAAPAGAAGAVVIAAGLVEAKQSVVENMAPVLTVVFTPLFAVMLAGCAAVYAVSGLGQDFDRELIAVFDVLLVVVLGLVLYGLSARPPSDRPRWQDGVQLLAVAAALVLDAMVLGTMLARIGDLGLTPNRVATLGLNVVLLVNLVGAAWLAARFLRGRVVFDRLIRWQTGYLPVFAVWTAAVVFLLPPAFGFA